ncbi:MAG: helix-turn-helix domain-containing protein [Candidatus Roseilinea sp.]|uniref:helix-turn-helix domain-containing protein n=1 Tax=Candidatus Roseilinea sp. TaxID=2838777 RepID=UPI00404A87C5
MRGAAWANCSTNEEKTMPDSLGYILKRLREKKHFTQQEVIERSGLERNASYISSLETNKTSPTIQELEALAVIYSTTAQPCSIYSARRKGLRRTGTPLRILTSGCC